MPKDNSNNKDNLKYFEFVENYIYLHHIGALVILPVWPETISDSMTVTFNQSSPLSRSAPIYSYASSGPRSIQFSFEFHRDMFNHMNYNNSNLSVLPGEDYVDTAVNYLQAAALPKYGAESKMVDPPMVSVRIGNELFIKGVVNGAVGTDHKLPLLNNNKYAIVTVNFKVDEVDPYDAETVSQIGGFRGINTSLERGIWKSNISQASPLYISNQTYHKL